MCPPQSTQLAASSKKVFFQRRGTTRSLVVTPSIFQRGQLCDLLRPRAAQAVGDQAQFALKEYNRREQVMVIAEAIFVERDIDLFGQPQWIVAVIFRPEVRVPTWW